MKRWGALVVFCVASCAAPKVDLPVAQSSAQDPAVLAEEATEQQLSYDAYLKDLEAIWRVGDKLEIANADLCRGHTAVISGIHVVTLSSTGERYRSAAIASFPDIARAATIAYVDPGSAADRAGVTRGDVVISADDTAIPADDRAPSILAAAFAQSGQSATRLTLKRSGQTVTVAVPGVTACSYAIEAIDSDKVNSYTDPGGIYVFKGMIDLLHSDNELAVIIGHEMGHNISGQIAAGLGSHLALAFGGDAAIVPLEEQADYVGLYAMARAGYDVNAAPAMWRRLAATVMPDAITATTDHPTFPVRVVMLRKEIDEIDAKVASGAPLVPDKMPDTGTVAPVAAAVGGH